MANSQDHYQVLGVSPQADLDAIKTAYRNEIRKHHPDKYTGERARIKRAGGDLRAIDRRIERAQQTTQRINEAYAVLSDRKKRRAYDDQRRYNRLQKQHPDTAYDEWRATVRRSGSRHRAPDDRPPTTAEEAFPWAVLAGLLVMLLVGFSFVSDFLWSIDNTERRIDRTAIGLDANEIQATTSTRYATQFARETAVAQPTFTPRSADANVRAAERLRENGLYDEALTLYDSAIERLPAAQAPYYGRAEIYRLLYAASDTPSDNSDVYYSGARADYAQAIAQGNDTFAAYEGRGLLEYHRWQQTDNPDAAAAARDDLQQAQSLAAQDDALTLGDAAQQALASLPDA